jgi:serine phosphatase RsbU (regulator of sigma subunit)
VTSSLKRCKINGVEVQIAVAKVKKFASPESGDTLEAIERPNGGISVVLADGQSSNRDAKAVSMMVVHKVLGLLADGIRDGAAARAASEALFTEKQGKVTCTLNIASVDLRSSTIVLTRNNPLPVFIWREDQTDFLREESLPLGSSKDVRPVVTEIEIESGLTLLIYTDGLLHAGEQRGETLDVSQVVDSLFDEQEPSPQELVDSLIGYAVKLDDGRPEDDISVLALKVVPRSGDEVRRMTVRLPISS